MSVSKSTRKDSRAKLWEKKKKQQQTQTILITMDATDSNQMVKHQGMWCLQQDQEACALGSPQLH